MAKHIATTRTNYFRVTDEAKYEVLIRKLASGNTITAFTKIDEHSNIWHSLGYYDDIDYDMNLFYERLQEILPDDDACIIQSVGHDKLHYVNGSVVVITRTDICSMSCSSWALTKAKELLGDDFETQLSQERD